MTLLINLPGAGGFKAQMVAPRGAVSATVPLFVVHSMFLEVAQRSHGVHYLRPAVA